MCDFDFVSELFKVVFDEWGVNKFIIFGNSLPPLLIWEVLFQVNVFYCVQLYLLQQLKSLTRYCLYHTNWTTCCTVVNTLAPLPLTTFLLHLFALSILYVLWFLNLLDSSQCGYFLSNVNLTYFCHTHLMQVMTITKVKL